MPVAYSELRHTGARAYCVAKGGLGMETKYVSFNPPRTTAVKMTRGPWMVGEFAGSWRFEEAGPRVTRVVFRYHLKPRPRRLVTAWLRALA